MSKTTIYDEIFEDIDENMDLDTPYTWDEVSKQFLNIKVYPKEGSSKRDRNMYIKIRNTYKQAINSLAFKYHKGWMLFVKKSGTHIIKTSDKILLEKITDTRTMKFFNVLAIWAKQGTWLLENEYIDPKKKRILRPFINGVYGLATIMIGQIQQSKMPREEKTQLLSRAKFFIEKDEEE
jgi:hypothetical protein